MPAEVVRFRWRIGVRDRWFLAAAAALALGGTPAAFLLAGQSSDPASGGGCVSTIRASVMGGATFTYCGRQAAAFCRSPQVADDAISQCEALGLRPRP